MGLPSLWDGLLFWGRPVVSLRSTTDYGAMMPLASKGNSAWRLDWGRDGAQPSSFGSDLNADRYCFAGAGMGAVEVIFCFAASIFSAIFLLSSRARDFCQALSASAVFPSLE